MTQPTEPKPGPVRRRRLITSETAVTLSLAEQREQQRAADKARFLVALEEHVGIITYACHATGIARRTVYAWLNDDPEFHRAVKDVDNVQMDMVERKLIENINSNDTRAITFYLSTKGRNRGYTTRVEVTTPPDQPINANVSVDVREARNEMGDRALGKALKAAMKANPAAFTEAARIAGFNGDVDVNPKGR